MPSSLQDWALPMKGELGTDMVNSHGVAEDNSTCKGLLAELNAVLVDPVCQGESCAGLCPELCLCSGVQDFRFDLFCLLVDFVTYRDIFKIKCMVRCYGEILHGEISQGNFISPDNS